jgi:hypothetical protein
MHGYIKREGSACISISHLQLFDVWISMSDVAICLCTMQLNAGLKIGEPRPARPHGLLIHAYPDQRSNTH